jgi:cytochrome c biogenesis protein CcmG/thiol:disulfide interchange protein DsbE
VRLDYEQIRAAPDVALNTYEGALFRLRDLRGKVVVLNFWASWCGPCRAEAPGLQQTWLDLHDQDVIFLGVDQADSLDAAHGYLREFGISYPNGPDNGIVQAFGVQSLPTTIIVGRDGLIRDTFWTTVEPGDLRARVEAALQSE